jgi:hypothetical protein
LFQFLMQSPQISCFVFDLDCLGIGCLGQGLHKVLPSPYF